MLKNIQVAESVYALELSMAAVAAAISVPSRVKILCALRDGRAWTATELNAVADIAPSTTSAHLTRLIDSTLISCLSQGRHRSYRLAGHDTAALLENMMGVSWKKMPSPERHAPWQMRTARTCYDHLAGEVAVQIYDQTIWLIMNGLHLMGLLLLPLAKNK